MNFFVCYDISDDKRRLRLSRLLEREGCKRIQKSVFVAPQFERKEMLRLKAQIERLLTVTYTEGASTDDSVLYIPLENDVIGDIVWQGDAARWEKIWKKDYGKII